MHALAVTKWCVAWAEVQEVAGLIPAGGTYIGRMQCGGRLSITMANHRD